MTAASVGGLPRRQARARDARDARRRRQNAALERSPAALHASTEEILDANARDVADAREAGLSPALIDRVTLDRGRIAAMAGGRADRRPARPARGADRGVPPPGRPAHQKLRVPLGVVAVVYEARPNVTIDAAALCLKSANAVVLRGSSSAATRMGCSRGRRRGGRDPPGCRKARSPTCRRPRERARRARRPDALIDLIIPRGGEGLKATLLAHATVPVIYAASGNCHVYVDAAADLEQAQRSCSTRRSRGPGSATPRRRCSSIAPSPRRSSRAC